MIWTLSLLGSVNNSPSGSRYLAHLLPLPKGYGFLGPQTMSGVWVVLLLLLLPWRMMALNDDGGLLLSFKYAVVDDPLGALGDWSYEDDSPCAWNGVMCMGIPLNTSSSATTSRVISLVLPDSRLLGSLPQELLLLEHLRHLDLSGNYLNGTLPAALFNASELRVVSLGNNDISGLIPEFQDLPGELPLQELNLSDNALTGRIPGGIGLLPNLTLVALRNNYLSGEFPAAAGGFLQLRVMDLSSNLLNGSLPEDLGLGRLQFLNVSHNQLAGGIPVGFGSAVPGNATVDLSFNNLTGIIPASPGLASQSPLSFAGNPGLCGTMIKKLCPIPSTLSNPPPNVSTTTSPPALAAIPRNRGEGSGSGSSAPSSGGLRPVVVAAIIVGDLAGIIVLFVVFLYLYQYKKRRRQSEQRGEKVAKLAPKGGPPPAEHAAAVTFFRGWCRRSGIGGSEESFDSGTTSESEPEKGRGKMAAGGGDKSGAQLVMVDTETELEVETLLKASAFILGAAGSSIVYKAVLADGSALAVRRIGDGGGRIKDFEAQVRGIAKLRHPNLLRIRGFYWGADEKLLISDYAANGSLGNFTLNAKLGLPRRQLTWEARLRIAGGIARCLAYLHDKKIVHRNIKPSNVLLDQDLSPLVGDLGLERFLFPGGGGGNTRGRPDPSSRRSSHSMPELSAAAAGAALYGPFPYHAPESLKAIKPSAKWDVYSFGVVLLELVAGRVMSEAELCRWNAGMVSEERDRVLAMADPAIRGEAEGREDAVLECFRLGFACAAFLPQRRPAMRDAAHVLDRLSYSVSSTSTDAAPSSSSSYFVQEM